MKFLKKNISCQPLCSHAQLPEPDRGVRGGGAGVQRQPAHGRHSWSRLEASHEKFSGRSDIGVKGVILTSRLYIVILSVCVIRMFIYGRNAFCFTLI